MGSAVLWMLLCVLFLPYFLALLLSDLSPLPLIYLLIPLFSFLLYQLPLRHHPPSSNPSRLVFQVPHQLSHLVATPFLMHTLSFCSCLFPSSSLFKSFSLICTYKAPILVSTRQYGIKRQEQNIS